MKRKYLSVLVASLALVALGLASIGQASAATLKEKGGTPFLAIYGFPPTQSEAERPVGGGLGRNFGFGENMLFRANTAEKIGKNLTITLGTGETAAVSVANDSFIGGTVMSNHTGVNNPLSFAIEFADFQDNEVTAAKKTEAAASYADTYDRHWVSEICPPTTVTKECRVDPRFTVGGGGAPEPTIKIEDVSFLLKTAVVGNVVVQGTVWAKWINGRENVETKKVEPPCIELTLPPKEAPTQTLVETQGPAVGALLTAISGEACLISANNNWYHVSSSVVKEPIIEITNE